jgi:hypothetical protein
MRNRTIKARNDALAHVVGEKLDVPGDDLGTVISRAGRALPRRLRKDAAYLTLTETMAGHPKLYHLVDPRRRKRAERALRAHVQDLDPARDRWDRTLGVIAGIVFGLLVFFGLLVTVLAWRGVIGPG